MIEARRRPASASTSTSQSHDEMRRHHGASLRSLSSGSGTQMEEDDDTPKRSTRGRNPLPRSTGPLFPPIPPKQREMPPGQSPKNTRTPPTAPSSVIPPFPTLSPLMSVDTVGPAQLLHEAASRPSTLTGERPELPSTSNTSLTPPPPTSDDAVRDMEDHVPEDGNEDVSPVANGRGHGGSDDWDTYQRQRGVRGFGAAPGDVKLEPSEEEATPVQERNGMRNHNRALSFQVPSVVDTPTQSTPPSVGSSSRQKKRRGEDLLLLDDHLLPAEMRKTGSLTGKRKGGTAKEEEDHEENVEVNGQQELDDLEALPTGGDEQTAADEREETEDTTRCVCRRDDTDTMMIQCDKCNVWQHGPCVGIWGDDEAPDEYFCEECKLDFHGPLRKWMRSRGRNPSAFVPPSPEDLLRFHTSSDRLPPSQSTRWLNYARRDPTPQKPHSRSHHRKDPVSPVETVGDGRRSTRGRMPSGSVVRDKSVPVVKNETSVSKDHKRWPSDQRRKVSIGGVHSISPSPTSQSPSASAHPSAPMAIKRRSTMNSRDAAYEEQVQAALEASKREAMFVNGHEESDAGDEGSQQPIEDEEEMELEQAQARNGKRKRDDGRSESVEPSLTPVPGSGKPKHPNQYTYRPKPPSSSHQVPPPIPSPARKGIQGGTPVPSLPAPLAQHEHGTRRAGAIANGTIPAPPTTYSVHNLHWHLPDHLSAFADLLPTPSPTTVEVRSTRVMPFLPKNHFHNQKYGPFSEDRDEQGRLLSPYDPPGREPIGESTTHLEPPARVRYPVKRITTAEIRKRVKNVSEYVGRVQHEEGRRKERAKLLGIDVKSLPAPAKFDDTGDVMMDETSAEEHPRETEIQTPKPDIASSTKLMDDLTRDLLALQDTFAPGGFASPFPLPIPRFPTQSPITTTLASGSAIDQHEPVAGVFGVEDTVEQVGQDEMVDVYREGEVGIVITQEIEQQAADAVGAAAEAEVAVV